MKEIYEIQYQDIDKNFKYEKIIEKVLQECFKVENLEEFDLYVSIILTTSENIKEYNNKYRNIDKETDVLSFPMFEKDELENKIKNKDFQTEDVLGDMIISVPKVKEQAIEFGHSFERELAYMVVHSFYHLMGFDHIEESDKEQMRLKEEFILDSLGIKREGEKSGK